MCIYVLEALLSLQTQTKCWGKDGAIHRAVRVLP